MQHTVSSAQDMRQIAADMARTLEKKSAATVITLSGELGAGKTTFTQGLAEALGIKETVNSPTFILEKVYKLAGQKFSHLIHMDAYRLKGPHEMRVLGWEEIVREPENLIVLEWPERVEALMPKGAIRIRIDIDGEARRITIDGVDAAEAKSG